MLDRRYIFKWLEFSYLIFYCHSLVLSGVAMDLDQFISICDPSTPQNSRFIALQLPGVAVAVVREIHGNKKSKCIHFGIGFEKDLTVCFNKKKMYYPPVELTFNISHQRGKRKIIDSKVPKCRGYVIVSRRVLPSQEMRWTSTSFTEVGFLGRFGFMSRESDAFPKWWDSEPYMDVLVWIANTCIHTLEI